MMPRCSAAESDPRIIPAGFDALEFLTGLTKDNKKSSIFQFYFFTLPYQVKTIGNAAQERQPFKEIKGWLLSGKPGYIER